MSGKIIASRRTGESATAAVFHAVATRLLCFVAAAALCVKHSTNVFPIFILVEKFTFKASMDILLYFTANNFCSGNILLIDIGGHWAANYSDWSRKEITVHNGLLFQRPQV